MTLLGLNLNSACRQRRQLKKGAQMGPKKNRKEEKSAAFRIAKSFKLSPYCSPFQTQIDAFESSPAGRDTNRVLLKIDCESLVIRFGLNRFSVFLDHKNEEEEPSCVKT